MAARAPRTRLLSQNSCLGRRAEAVATEARANVRYNPTTDLNI